MTHTRKSLWDSQLVRNLLRNRLASACWRPFSPLYNALLTHVVFRRGVRKQIGPYIFRIGVQHRRLATAHYSDEIEWMLQSLKYGMSVFDIGANIGITSLVFAKAVGSRGSVFSFEPSPDSFASLQEQIRLNRMETIITPLDCAVSNQPGDMDFWMNEDPYDMQHGPAGVPGQSRCKIQVKTVTVDSFCREHRLRPDVIKIDVEGFEPFVLEGAAELIRQTPDITLFVELHPWVWNSIGYDETKTIELFKQLGLTAKTRDGQTLARIPERLHVILKRI